MSDVLKVEVAQLFDFSEQKDEKTLRKELLNKIETYSLEKLNLLSDFLKVVDAY